MYWFVHLATITELNGWDAMNPGHLDRYFFPFYRADLAAGRISREQAKELLACFWIKFNNHPAPPKVGVTAEESGTYNDFTNINIGGVLRDGSDGVNELSYMMLEVMEEIHLLQPQGNLQLSRRNDDRFLRAGMRVVRKGYGYPSFFNCEGIVKQLQRCGRASRMRGRAAPADAWKPAPLARRHTSSPGTSTCRRSSRSRFMMAWTRAPEKGSEPGQGIRAPSRALKM